jgi:hypothetical protein
MDTREAGCCSVDGYDTSPASGVIDMTHNTSVTTTFSEPIEPTSLTTSPFTLVRDETTTPNSATVGLSSDGKKATLTPKIALNSRTTYRATV